LRLDGKEFAILLPATPLDGAMKLADDLRLTFERLDLKKKSQPVMTDSSIIFGAGGRNRTGTGLPPVDFESVILGVLKTMRFQYIEFM
jgi:GGDEF domain-containing protein